ncbi:hypothetical protein MBRA1_001425 [Malassezia brasiliensis]|uniref:N-acetyltransferase domain-containing protein n=1 Tax=Malassezia brasiliensis TaxID=1821822 RepID=A0AAF0DS95_9BASI|nr:hypothetical protein MBRA1_001425 [Malassezia brasiliensis]
MPLGRSSKAGHGANTDAQDAEAAAEATHHIEFRSSFTLGWRGSISSGRQERADSASSTKSRAKEAGQGRRPQINIDIVRPDEIRAAHSIEAASFPREEVTHLSQLIKRHEQAPQFFLGAFQHLPPPMVAGPLSGETRRRLIGFCTATVAPAAITQSMYGNTNSELAHVVCIHDFCIESGSQGRGIGQRLMRKLLGRIEAGYSGDGKPMRQHFERVTVVTPPKSMSFFMKCGFKIHGPSYIAKSSEPWVEMRYTVESPPEIQRGDLSTSLVDQMDDSISPTATSEHALSTSDHPGEHVSSGPGSADHSTSAAWGIGSYSQSPVEAPALPSDQVLAALLEQNCLSEGAARDLGLPMRAPEGAGAPTQPQPLNPGKLLSAVFGQAVAAKTASEDSLTALKARIVSRADGRNLCRLFCPNERCHCVIVGRQAASWQAREMGPLSEKDAVSIESELILLDHTSKSTPMLNAEIQARLPGNELSTIGPVRAFWALNGPMQFDNVSFSKNTLWKVPEPSSNSQEVPRSLSSGSETQGGPGRRSEPRSPSTFATRMNSMQSSLSKSDESSESSMPMRSKELFTLGLTPGEERIVKYILCPDCGCGPLGFMILPASASSEQAAQKGYSDITCYLAAYRVRYEL